MVKRPHIFLSAIASGLIVTVVAARSSPSHAEQGARAPDIATRLLEAYPDALDRIEGNDLIWRDGTRMRIADGRGPKTQDETVQNPDIIDMLATAYPVGAAADPPPAGVDPGRARPSAFFDKLYGTCRSGGVSANLVDVVWLPSKGRRLLKFSSRHGAARALKAVSDRLDTLPSRFDAYLRTPAATYLCRMIEGTNRPSPHGHGIAIDIAIPHAHYWRWSKPKASGVPAYRNAIPMDIVAAFEAEGFIWGGRWHLYDTMHFEFRPELVLPMRPKR
jgi:hypothetical protein